jgi:hypothetical protein
MPRYKVTMPDGKSYSIEGPAGASKDQVIAAVQKRIGAVAATGTTFGGQLEEVAKGVIPGAAGLLETAATGAASLLPEEQEQAVRAKATELANVAREKFKAAPGYEESIGRKLGEGIGSTVPFFALGEFGLAGRAIAAGTALAAGAGEARQRAEQEGGEANKGLATLGGAAVGLTDVLPVFRFIKRLPEDVQMTFVNRVRRALVTAGEEGAQEAAQQIGQNLIAKGLYKPDQSLIESAGEEGAYGAGVGAFVQVLTDMALGRRAHITEPKPRTGEEKLADPEPPPVAPPGTPAAAQEEIAKTDKVEADLRQALKEEAQQKSADEDFLKERKAVAAEQKMLEEPSLAQEAPQGLDYDPEAREREADRLEAEEAYYRDALEAERQMPEERDLEEPVYAPEVQVAKSLIDAVDTGGIPLNPVKVNRIAEDLGLEVSKKAKPEDTIERIRTAVDRATETPAPAAVELPEIELRPAAIDVIKQTGRTNVDTFRKNLEISLPEAKALRQSMIDDGLLIKKGNTYVLQETVGEVENAVLRPGNIEDNVRETVGGSDVLPSPRQAPAGPISSGPESVAVDRAVEPAPNIVGRETGIAPAIEPAPAPVTPRRPVNESTRAEVLRAFAALEAEQAGAKQPETTGQQGLELLGGTAKPVLSSAETKILDQLKSAAVYLNSTGKINADERTQINAEVRKSKPDLAKLKKLIDKIASREDEDTNLAEAEAQPEDLDQVGPSQSEDDIDYYDTSGPESFKELRFQRTPIGGGMDPAVVEDIAQKIAANWKNKPGINVLQSVSDIPDALRAMVPDDAAGFYYKGQVYLIADNSFNEAAVRGTVFHESLGHYGIRELFGKRLGEVLTSIYKTNPAMRKAADQWLKDNPNTYAKASDAVQRALAVEEVLARASEQGVIKNVGIRAAFNRVAAMIRQFARSMGIQVSYSNNDIRQVLIQAHDQVTTRDRRGRVDTTETVALQRKREADHLSDIFDVEMQAPNYDKQVGDTARGWFENVGGNLRRFGLGLLSIGQQAEVWEKELPVIKELDKILEERGATEMGRREVISKNVTNWFEVANEYKDKPEVLDNFFKIANMTTVYQVDPLEESVQEILRKPVKDMTPFDKVTHDIVKEYNKLPEDLRQAYKDARAYYDNSSVQFEKLLEQRLGKDALDRIKAKYDLKKLKVYLPLWRDGNYWLSFTDKAGETITSAYASNVERERAAEAAKAEGGKDFQAFERLRDARKGAPPTGFLGDVVAALEKAGVPEDAVDAVYEAYLNYLPAESVRQLRRPREAMFDMATGVDRYGVFGFEPDIFQAYANVAPRIANQLTNLEYAIPLEEAVNTLYAQAGGNKPTNPVHADVYRNIKKQVDNIRNPPNTLASKMIDKAGSLSYLWFIAGNISSAIVNTTQVPLVVAPLLGGKYGPVNAFNALEKAYATYAGGGWDVNNGGKKAFPSDFTFGASEKLTAGEKKLYETAVARSAIRRSTGYELSEAKKSGIKDYTGIKARVTHGLNWIFQNSERLNREVTLLAAYNLAYDAQPAGSKNVDAAIEEALKLTKEAHGTALAEAGPRLFQQGFGKVMFTFKRFAQSQIYLLSKLFKQAFKDADPEVRGVAAKQLIGIYGTAFILAGLQGMPGYGLAEFLMNLIKGDDDEPYDFGSTLSETNRKGLVNQIFGVDVASRTGFNGILWRDNPARMAEVGPAAYALEQTLGPAYGAFISAQRGGKLLSEGEYQRGFEAITPSFIRNGLKAIRYAEEGVRNKDGTPVVKDLSAYKLLMQAVGFNPAPVAEARESAGADYEIKRKLETRRQSLITQYGAAWREKDRQGMAEALRSIQKFNAKNPQRGLRIEGSTLTRSIAESRRRQMQSVNGLYMSPQLRSRVNQVREKESID